MQLLALLALATLTPSAPPAQTYSFSVKVVGKGKPVILIPGLTCTGEVWDGTVAQLSGKYRCYVLTLPGFGKQAPIKGAYLSHVRDDIIAYVKAEKLDHPAVIGHSLGGFMTYYLAIAEPKLWGPMVSVDGLPFLARGLNPTATSASMQPIADNIAKQMLSATPDQFKGGIKSSLTGQITSPKDVEAVFQTSRDSDQGDVAEAMKELLTTDLRSQVSAIESPFLLIGAGQQAKGDAARKSLTEVYASQIRPIRKGTLMDWDARHFVMLDAPAVFYKVVKEFLDSND
jgi:pimeloyl-ACP methyl ester carboxylesterase